MLILPTNNLHSQYIHNTFAVHSQQYSHIHNKLTPSLLFFLFYLIRPIRAHSAFVFLWLHSSLHAPLHLSLSLFFTAIFSLLISLHVIQAIWSSTIEDSPFITFVLSFLSPAKTLVADSSHLTPLQMHIVDAFHLTFRLLLETRHSSPLFLASRLEPSSSILSTPSSLSSLEFLKRRQSCRLSPLLWTASEHFSNVSERVCHLLISYGTVARLAPCTGRPFHAVSNIYERSISLSNGSFVTERVLLYPCCLFFFSLHLMVEWLRQCQMEAWDALLHWNWIYTFIQTNVPVKMEVKSTFSRLIRSRRLGKLDLSFSGPVCLSPCPCLICLWRSERRRWCLWRIQFLGKVKGKIICWRPASWMLQVMLYVRREEKDTLGTRMIYCYTRWMIIGVAPEGWTDDRIKRVKVVSVGIHCLPMVD